MSAHQVIRCIPLLALLIGTGARADKEAQQTVDVKAKPACGCVTPCTDKGDDSWCFTKWSCDVSSTGVRGAWRYCDPNAEKARMQDELLAPGCDEGKWQTFRNGLIDDYPAGQDSVLRALDACRHHISYTSAKKPVKDKYETCVGRLEKLYKVLTRPGLGLSKNTDAYHAQYGAKLAIPAELANEGLFGDLQAANLSDAASVKRVVDRITGPKGLAKSAIVLPYVSPGTGSLDRPETFGRIVVWMNSGGMSRYVQFSVNAKPGDTTANRFQASVVNVDGTGAYIFDWTRSTTDRHVFEYKSDSNQNNQKCYQCHTNGLLAIHPFDAAHQEADPGVAKALGEGYADWLGPLNAAYAKNLSDLNGKITADYRSARRVADAPDRTLDGAFSGGAMMPDPMVTPARGKACTDAVAAIFNGAPGPKGCLSCHERRGSPIVSETSMQTMMNRYIGLGFMPGRNAATTETRMEAARCYVEAYSLGIPDSAVVTWLKAPACE